MREKENPGTKPGKARGGDGRAERLAAALRANLGRRKAQQRARSADDGEGAGTAGDGDEEQG